MIFGLQYCVCTAHWADILVTDLSHHEVSDYGTVSKLMSIGNAHR